MRTKLCWVAACAAVGLVAFAGPGWAEEDVDLDALLGIGDEGAGEEPAPAPVEDAPAPVEDAPAPVEDAPAPVRDAAPVPESAQQADEARTDTQAEAPQGQPVRSGPKNRLTDEIVVTAQKREENAQDVPVSITAFSNETLDAKGIDEPIDLAQFTPGMYYGSQVNFAIIYLRGVGSDAFLPDSDPSVATYIDGIYYPFANGQSQAFGAVERVEILKGPQGTLFGRNATGGAINVITKAPNVEDYEASLQASYESFDTFKGRLYVNVPIADFAAFAVSGIYHTGDNYYEGTVDKGRSDLPREISKGVRAKLRVQPFEELTMDVSYIKYLQDGLGSTAMPNVAPSTISQALGIRAETEDYRVDVDVPSYFALDNEVWYGQIEWKPRWFDMKILASKQDITTDNNYDFDGSDTPFITFDARGQFADVTTAEIQFLSNGEFGPDWLEWIVGAYYLEQTTGFPRNRLAVASLDLSDGGISIPNPLGGPPIPIFLPNQLINFLGNLPLPIPDGVSVVLVSLQEAETFAFYTQETIHLFDRFHLTLGARYQTEERAVIESSSNLGTLNQQDIQLLNFTPAPQKNSNFTPKVSLAVDVFEDAMVYASWTKGFKSGTFNTTNIYDEAEYVQPEEITTYELGFKSTFWGGLLQLNGAVFQNKIENLQVLFISLLAGGAATLENAAEARIRGFELDFQASPLPELLPGLVIFGGGAFLKGEYLSYPNGSGYDDQTGLYNFGNGDFTGNTTTRTPKFSGSIGVNQLIELGPGDLEIGASLYYNSGFYYQASNTDVSKEGSYMVVDAQISYFLRDYGARLTVFGKNLTDDRYTYTQFHTDAGRQDYLAPPRSFGVRLNVDY